MVAKKSTILNLTSSWLWRWALYLKRKCIEKEEKAFDKRRGGQAASHSPEATRLPWSLEQVQGIRQDPCLMALTGAGSDGKCALRRGVPRDYHTK